MYTYKEYILEIYLIYLTDKQGEKTVQHVT